MMVYRLEEIQVGALTGFNDFIFFDGEDLGLRNVEGNQFGLELRRGRREFRAGAEKGFNSLAKLAESFDRVFVQL